MRRLAVSILAVLAVGLPAQADARSWRLSSPGGQVTVAVHGAGDAPLSATVRHAGARVLDLRIGLRAGGRCLPQGLRYRGSARARVDERYTTPAGKRRDHRYVARRLVLAFRTGRTRAEVRLQASDDGVAYRTTVHGAAPTVTAECSTVRRHRRRARLAPALHGRATSGRTRRARCGPRRPARSASRR